MFFENFSRGKLEAELNDELLRTVKIIVIALNVGVLFFLSICLFLYFKNQSVEFGENSSTDLYNILLIAMFVLMLAMIILSNIIPKRVFNEDYYSTKALLMSKESDINKLIGTINTYYIVKFAMLEGTALFGCVILITTTLSGDIYTHGIYWLSILPVIFMFVMSAINFPTKEKVINVILENNQR